MAALYPGQSADYHLFNLDNVEEAEGTVPVPQMEVVHCYGLLYHLRNPLPMLKWARAKCSDIMVVETAVSPRLWLAKRRKAPDRAARVGFAFIGAATRIAFSLA
ncbi:MAG TPA: hypothetical protein VK196_06410 [Magnetospirillum sp.]|nr:hypothetical protein [Magnetospirillum sp.]